MTYKHAYPSRRRFLQATAALAFPTIIPRYVLGQDGQKPPSEKITVASIGWGMQGPSNTNELMLLDDVKVVALCDLDKKHLEEGVGKINSFYKNQDCKAYSDYKELLARKDIDAVMIAIPDHWHALVSIEAAKNKKHIYGEKPLAKTLAEQQAIVKAVKENDVIWQTGSWQRSGTDFRRACEVVRNGLLGKLTRVEVGLPSGHNDFAGTKSKDQVTPPPEHLDYDRWCGPSEMIPYIEARVHKNWRWHYAFGGGQLLDWIGHHGDIAHWGLGCDEDGGPLELEGTAEFPEKDAIWNTATKYKIECKYPTDVPVIIAGGHGEIQGGAKWIGENGWIRVDRGKTEASNKEWVGRDQPDDVRKIKLYDSPGHMRNFIDCVRSHKPTITPVHVAHRSASAGHLAQIAIMTGRKIKWDPVKEQIIGDDEAAKLLGRGYRAPWVL